MSYRNQPTQEDIDKMEEEERRKSIFYLAQKGRLPKAANLDELVSKWMSLKIWELIRPQEVPNKHHEGTKFSTWLRSQKGYKNLL